MKPALKTGIVIALLTASIAAPCVLRHHARLALDAQREALARQTSTLSALVEDKARLSNLVPQANAPGPLTEEQLRELLRLRNERRWLREQTDLLARLLAENDHLKTNLATGTMAPAELSPTELQAALSGEMREALRRILAALQPALQRYAQVHTNQWPGSFTDLQDYFPMVDGRKMVGLVTFSFVREQTLRPGEALIVPPDDALLLYGDVGRRSAEGRPGEGATMRVYGFTHGRVLEVSSEDGNFNEWEKQHLTSAPAGTEDKIYLEAEGTVRDRTRMVELGASLGISAVDANRFFEKLKEQEKSLSARIEEMRKNLPGSPEEQERQMQPAIEQELSKLALETLGDKGPALVRKLVERK